MDLILIIIAAILVIWLLGKCLDGIREAIIFLYHVIMFIWEGIKWCMKKIEKYKKKER